ncbi:flagellar biosynthesis anti-sigma factor FlgM [Kushneria phosphatilytica]|uniref:flagellar biosynthesis anti-sigma factor FlgM n=1 Tax=Kushneria phosphatilytica TaxID=657387 RepID=UPI0008DA645A|nr:flagellar biosynthesis anti-sigma factor FlgM [Kushneria phosphatilytica]OHV12027.1 flagellar biosynthesis anti-sigma factor FlgM [Kushneria phosphatilytica]
MKIDSSTNITHIQTGTTRDTQRGSGDKSATQVSEVSSSWKPSSASDASRDIDTAKVDEIRQAIRDGSFEIRSDRIADGLIQSAQELIGDQS